jgi:hypothetical protein
MAAPDMDGIVTDFRALFHAYLSRDDEAIARVLHGMTSTERDRVLMYALQLLRTALSSDS